MGITLIDYFRYTAVFSKKKSAIRSMSLFSRNDAPEFKAFEDYSSLIFDLLEMDEFLSRKTYINQYETSTSFSRGYIHEIN